MHKYSAKNPNTVPLIPGPANDPSYGLDWPAVVRRRQPILVRNSNGYQNKCFHHIRSDDPCNSIYVLEGICGLLLGNSVATVTIAVTGRFMVTFALNTMMQISSEILPTQLRYTVK